MVYGGEQDLALGMDDVQTHLPVDCQEGLFTNDLFPASRSARTR